MTRTCTTCGEPAADDDRFCEACGAALTDAATPDPVPAPGGRRRTDLRAAAGRPHGCPDCGPGTLGADGYCDECGRPGAAGRDHVEEAVEGAAALTDRGLVRRRNEDAYAVVTAGSSTFAVVCDGVASVPGGAAASLAACEAAADVAADGLAAGRDPAELAAESAEAAFAAVAGLPAADLAEELLERGAGRDGPPACTYVSALVGPDGIVVSWVGDSRAYWLADDVEQDPDPEDVTRAVTVDDSWAAEMVAAGLRDAASAWSDRRAHVITRWLAADAPGHPARTVLLRPTRPGVLLLCSDGLWNHLPDADDLAALRVGGRGTAELAASARSLLRAALDEGGHDNTTVVLVDATVAASGPASGPGAGR